MRVAHSFSCVSVRSSKLPWYSAVRFASRQELNKRENLALNAINFVLLMLYVRADR